MDRKAILIVLGTLAFTVLALLAGAGVYAFRDVLLDPYSDRAAAACQCSRDGAPEGHWRPANPFVQLNVNDGYERRGELWRVDTDGRHNYWFHRVYEWAPGSPARPGGQNVPTGSLPGKPIGEAGPQ